MALKYDIDKDEFILGITVKSIDRPWNLNDISPKFLATLYELYTQNCRCNCNRCSYNRMNICLLGICESLFACLAEKFDDDKYNKAQGITLVALAKELAEKYENERN